MNAQKLYDLREKYEFCSGSDLHEFFHEQTGQMSPSGSVELPVGSAIKFVEKCAFAVSWNSPSLAEDMVYAIQATHRVEEEAVAEIAKRARARFVAKES